MIYGWNERRGWAAYLEMRLRNFYGDSTDFYGGKREITQPHADTDSRLGELRDRSADKTVWSLRAHSAGKD